MERSRRVVGWVAVLLVAPWAWGCTDGGRPSGEETPPNIAATYIAAGPPGACINRCWSKVVPLIRGELGLDPEATGTYDLGRPGRLMESLANESSRVGGFARPLSIAEGVARVKPGGGGKVALTDEDGHLYLVLGVIEDQGRVRYQFTHGDSSIHLLSKDEIVNAKFCNAWELGRPSGVVLPITVGPCRATIDKISHNFGHIKPNQDLRTTFTIANLSNDPLLIGIPRPSCSCTTTTMNKPVRLEAGQEHEVPFLIRTSDSPSLRQYVQLSIAGREGLEPRELILELTGSQFGAMLVMPRELNFGVVTPGGKHELSFRMQETVTDRFTIKSVSPEGLPISTTVAKREDHHGLRTYEVRCTLVPDDSSGQRRGSIVVTTDSRYFEKVPLRVIYEKAPSFKILPSAVALGEIGVGEACHEQIRISSRTEKVDAVEAVETPAGVIAKTGWSEGPLLDLTFKLDKPGIWQGVVKMKVRIGSRSEPVEVPCAAYVRASRMGPP